MAFLTKSSDNKNKSGLANHTGTQLNGLPLQAKLRIGKPNDAFEQEADKISDRVANNPTSEPIQRQSEEEKPVQTKPLIHEISRYIQRQATEEEKQPVQKQATEEEQPVQKQATEEEKQPVQKQATEEEKQPVQKQATEEEQPVQKQATEEEQPVQKQATEEEEKPVQTQKMEDEEKPVQTQGGMDAVQNDPETEQMLMASKAGGMPLEPDVLQEMENQFGTSFSQVRIHTDQTAIELCRRFNAEAFTHGNHIYFNEGKYDPTSTEGKRLLAHEFTHIVQQTDMIQREETETSPNQSIFQVTRGDYRGTNINVASKELTISKVSIPNFKRRNSSKYDVAKTFTLGEIGERDTDQRNTWRNDSNINRGATEARDTKIREADEIGGKNPEGIYFFRAKRNRSFMMIGTRENLLNSFILPTWDRRGQGRFFQVDHIVEHQLGGDDSATNYELLDSRANASAGGRLMWQIRRRIREALQSLHNQNNNDSRLPPIPSSLSAADNIRRDLGYTVKFLDYDFNLEIRSGSEDQDFWSLQDILRGNHARSVEPLPSAEVERMGEEGFVVFFVNRSGGRQLQKPANQQPDWIPRIDYINWEPAPEQQNILADQPTGTLKLRFYSRPRRGVPIQGSDQEQSLTIKKIPGVSGGYIDSDDLSQELKSFFRFEGLSPIEFDTLQIDASQGLLATGKIIPSISFLGENASIDLILSGNDIEFRKSFDLGDINIPSPFELTASSLTVFFGTGRGLGIEGQTDFAIQGVGEGFIGAAASTSGGFELEGEFNFDSQLFDPARVGVTYRNNTFGVTGEIGIPRGKVRGIKSARINVAYAEGNFTANGEAELDIRGVERGTLSVSYSEQGWSIGGTFNLSRDIPRIRSGSISVTVAKVAGEEGYRVTAIGTAVPDIPGIDSQLTVEYDNGALKIEGEASYNRGLLSGQVNIGATNRALGADGQPTGDPGEDFIIYGGGSLTIRITPWLQGTVGVQFLPNGEIEVSGSIGIPGVVEVFRRLEVPDRELIGIGFDIPIFAIPVGPRSIGLKATIAGGLRAYAGIGPGRLEQLELGIVYNPAREEETHVTGNGRFVIPADAGLRLVVSATIGLDALVGGVEGGLELGGGLGLEASAEANVNVDWTPTSGLELNASLGAFVEPKFIFTIDGVIRAWFTFYEKEWRWRLADYEYGSNLRFGVQLPIHYREGEPFDISFDDLQLTYPQIDARSFLRGLIRDIRDRKE
jgi:hypothetical protein